MKAQPGPGAAFRLTRYFSIACFIGMLRLLSCGEMQGYLFSKPVPAEVFEAKFLAAPVVA